MRIYFTVGAFNDSNSAFLDAHNYWVGSDINDLEKFIKHCLPQEYWRHISSIVLYSNGRGYRLDYCMRCNSPILAYRGEVLRQTLCDNCSLLCSFCGRDRVYNHNMDVCENCYSNTDVCASCGSRRIIAEMYDDDYIRLCEYCATTHYATCDVCHRFYLLHEYDYCPHCNSRGGANYPVHPYHYKPTPHFYGKGKLFMGVELEVEANNGVNDLTKEFKSLKELVGKRAYLKEDSSLGDTGVEIVTHPLTLAEHKKTWKGWLRYLRSKRYTSHNNRRCGLHIHVNKNFFNTNGTDESDFAGFKLIYLFNKFRHKFITFSRRTESQLGEFCYFVRCDRVGNTRQEIKYFIDDVKHNKYVALNLGNQDTMEFRFPRGTLRTAVFFATLEFIDLLCRIVKRTGQGRLKDMQWVDILKYSKNRRYNYLIGYLEERGLNNV